MIHEIFEQVLNDHIPEKECGIFLSGGMDSISLAFAAHRMGKKINAYSFKLDNFDTYDHLKAKEISEQFGWNFISTTVPTTNITQDFHRLIFEYGCSKKTFVECMFPFLYIYPNIIDKKVICGVGDPYGTTKKVVMNFKEPKSLFDEYRINNYKKKIGIDQHKPLSDQYGIEIIYPLYDDRVFNYFLQFDWYELNKPVQKRHVREEYAEELSKVGKVKPGINLQIGADIDHLFETLLNNPAINFKNRSRVMDIVRDWCYIRDNQTSTLDNFFQ